MFIGSTAGRVYAFSTSNGKLRWSHQTGRYVYASAAVSRVRGWGRTVFVGSYDGRFYALDAGSGRVRWTYNSGGKISGSATVIGRVVYFADLGHRRTIGLGTKTGRVSFRRSQGAYDPVISDGKHLYLTGNHSLTALRPLQRHGKAAEQRAARRARRAAHRKARAEGGPEGGAPQGGAQARARKRARAKRAARRRRRTARRRGRPRGRGRRSAPRGGRRTARRRGRPRTSGPRSAAPRAGAASLDA